MKKMILFLIPILFIGLSKRSAQEEGYQEKQ